MSQVHDAEKANKKYDDDTVAYTEDASVVGLTERRLGVSPCALVGSAGSAREAGPVACSGTTDDGGLTGWAGSGLDGCSGSKRLHCC